MFEIGQHFRRINTFLVQFKGSAMSSLNILHLSESDVKHILNWPLVYEAIEQSLRSISKTKVSESQPIAEQPTRIFTPMPNGAGKSDFKFQSIRIEYFV